ncbi:MAG: histidinol dehydrogenase [Flavobacteriaceae bacterium]
MEIVYNPQKEKWNEICSRLATSYSENELVVKKIFEDVKNKGDEALTKYTLKYDNVLIKDFLVSETEISDSKDNVDSELKKAISVAYNNIYKFHYAQKSKKIIVETSKGVECWQKKYPIEKVGLYIPGGTAPLFSTLLMLAIPAKIAGCEEIIVCTPPGIDGNVSNVILYTAFLCGIKKLYKIGGIQSIAALSIGTESIPKVYKIFGPGNQFINSAKQYALKYNVSIDLPAGPSEVLIVADKTCNPSFVAIDLLAQAEHGKDSQSILVANDNDVIESVLKEIKKLMYKLNRKNILNDSMKNSKFVIFKSDEDAVNFINYYAPEHYMICVEKKQFYIDGLKNAGSVFIGNFSPETLGDYASGTNHTLPTSGFARQYSGVNLDSFLKSITFQKITKDGIRNIGPHVELLAGAEGLDAHKMSVSLRLKEIQND